MLPQLPTAYEDEFLAAELPLPNSSTAIPDANVQAKAVHVQQICPNCSQTLIGHHCKLVCPQCGYFLSCADFY
jgi:Zn finger protein HypA/HybF involved in hydrogenase expression